MWGEARQDHPAAQLRRPRGPPAGPSEGGGGRTGPPGGAAGAASGPSAAALPRRPRFGAASTATSTTGSASSTTATARLRPAGFVSAAAVLRGVLADWDVAWLGLLNSCPSAASRDATTHRDFERSLLGASRSFPQVRGISLADHCRSRPLSARQPSQTSAGNRGREPS